MLLSADEAGWRYCGLRVLGFGDGETRTVATGDTEVFLLPLSARGVTVEIDGDTFRLEGAERSAAEALHRRLDQ